MLPENENMCAKGNGGCHITSNTFKTEGKGNNRKYSMPFKIYKISLRNESVNYDT